jgi:hypothetical protein
MLLLSTPQIFECACVLWIEFTTMIRQLTGIGTAGSRAPVLDNAVLRFTSFAFGEELFPSTA